MVDPETNTTPISCGNAASDDSHASPTPTKLTAGDFFQHDDALEVDTEAGLSPSKTFPSTPSSSPYSDARDRGGGNDHVIQDRPGAVAVGTATVNHSMAATMLGLKLDGHETELDMPRLVFGCVFSYLVLGLWVSHPMFKVALSLCSITSNLVALLIFTSNCIIYTLSDLYNYFSASHDPAEELYRGIRRFEGGHHRPLRTVLCRSLHGKIGMCSLYYIWTHLRCCYTRDKLF